MKKLIFWISLTALLTGCGKYSELEMSLAKDPAAVAVNYALPLVRR